MRVAVIGTGIMGFPMADKLLVAGNEVKVYNRTPERSSPLLDKGAVRADTPAKAACDSDVVITMLTDPTAVEAVALGPDGILETLDKDSVHCDMSTVTPSSSERLARIYSDRDLSFVQAPVLGSKKQIMEGTLLIFAGGHDAAIGKCARAWSAFASKTWIFPTQRQAAAAKLACNMLIANTILGLGQSLIYAAKSGVEPATLLDILGESAMGCPMIANKGRTILDRNFIPNFTVRNMLKDLNLAEESGSEEGVPLPFASLARHLYVTAMDQGLEGDDYSGVVKTLENLAEVELRR